MKRKVIIDPRFDAIIVVKKQIIEQRKKPLVNVKKIIAPGKLKNELNTINTKIIQNIKIKFVSLYVIIIRFCLKRICNKSISKKKNKRNIKNGINKRTNRKIFFILQFLNSDLFNIIPTQ